METYNINYKGKEYPAIDITIFEGTEDVMDVTVSSVYLEDELLEDIRNCIGADEAYRLDMSICYYLTPEEMALSYNKIVQIVEASYL